MAARFWRTLGLCGVAAVIGCAPPKVQTALTSINRYQPPADPAAYFKTHHAPVRIGVAQRLVYPGQGTKPGDVWLAQATNALKGFARYVEPAFAGVADPVSLRKRPDYLVELGVKVHVKGDAGVRTVEAEMVMNLFDRYHHELLLKPRPFAVARIVYNPKGRDVQWLDKQGTNVFDKLFRLQFAEMTQKILEYHRTRQGKTMGRLPRPGLARLAR